MRVGSAYPTEMLPSIEQSRTIVSQALATLGDFCDVPRADGAFYFLLRLHTDHDPMRLVERLIVEHRVAVIPGTTFGVDDGCTLRVAYGALDKDTAAQGIGRLTAGRDVEIRRPDHRRDFIHVHDLAAATCAILESDIEGAINVGAGKLHAVREVVETLATLIGGAGRPVFGAPDGSDDEPAELAPDLTRLFQQVGWTPAIDLAAGLRQTLAAWRSAP